MCACVNKKSKNQGQVIHETDRTGDGHNNPRGPALFSQAASLKTIKHNEKLVYPQKNKLNKSCCKGGSDSLPNS